MPFILEVGKAERPQEAAAELKPWRLRQGQVESRVVEPRPVLESGATPQAACLEEEAEAERLGFSS